MNFQTPPRYRPENHFQGSVPLWTFPKRRPKSGNHEHYIRVDKFLFWVSNHPPSSRVSGRSSTLPVTDIWPRFGLVLNRVPMLCWTQEVEDYEDEGIARSH